MSDETRMCICSDEDGEVAFVLKDEHAPTEDAVYEGWRAAAKRDWGLEYEPDEVDVSLRYYKQHPSNEEALIECGADEGEAWWCFELPPELPPAVSGGEDRPQ